MAKMAHFHDYSNVLWRQCIKRSCSNFLQRKLRVNAVFVRNSTNLPLEYTQDKDPAPYFFNEDVQNILKKLTRVNLNKVFKQRQLGERQLEVPTYKFMTDDELKTALDDAAGRANDILQMPPVVKLRDKIEHVLSRDLALKGYDTAKYVFTDITYGISNRDRLIVVRSPNGDLCKANWDVRHRMNQIYFPLAGRELHTPKMFEVEHLNKLLECKEYVFVLDRACTQFEPDDPEYQRVAGLTYQHVDTSSSFELLRSTRHFGPLAFYLAWFGHIDNLLLELIQTGHVEDAGALVALHGRLHGGDVAQDGDTRPLERFIASSSRKRAQLELALQAYRELRAQQQQLQQGLRRAHGLT